MRRDKLFDSRLRNAKINNRRFFKREFKRSKTINWFKL